MKVTIGPDTYIVSWKHEQNNDAVRYRTVPDIHRNCYCDDCPMQNKLYPCYPPRNCRKVAKELKIYNRGHTTCIIKKGYTVIVEVTADCPVDEKDFIKSIGRKTSLSMALAAAFPGHEHQAPANPENREIRRVFWAIYNSRSME